ncbi:MAG: hypothetical protein OXQ29_18690 [Rhodospirillaceae bacterium]|nr:hypothetical protein [Rhodospirillaceae bacterium]
MKTEMTIKAVLATIAFVVSANAQDASPWEECDAWRGVGSQHLGTCAERLHSYITSYAGWERHWEVRDFNRLTNRYNEAISYQVFASTPGACYLGTEKIGRTGRGSVVPKERLFFLGGSAGTSSIAHFVGYVEYSIDDSEFSNETTFYWYDPGNDPTKCRIAACDYAPKDDECARGRRFLRDLEDAVEALAD